MREPMTPASGDPVDVSVVIVTYNHERYIERALDSVLSQQTDRRMEVIISEDCSTDRTRQMVVEVGRSDPRVTLHLSERNLRSNAVVARGLTAARGELVCLLDGDDYWTSPDKIERQAELLRAHPDVTAIFHNAQVCRGEELTELRWTPSTTPGRVTAAQLWEGNPFATCAGMMRRTALRDLGPWYHELFPITDWPLYALCARDGDLLFVDEPVGAYRLHDGGEFTALREADKLDTEARFYRTMLRVMPDAAPAIRTGASRYFLGVGARHGEAGQRRLARHCLRHALRVGGGRTAVRRDALAIGRRAWRP